MKLNRLAARWLCAIIVLLLFFPIANLAKDKAIKLRNETIFTQPKKAQPAPPNKTRNPNPGNASGLFLIQFEDTVTPDWKEALRVIGIDLLRYVPEDAFIARINNVPIPQLEALPFVRWVGEYRPEHKVHVSLRPTAKKQPAGDSLWVSVLLSPVANAAEKGQVRAAFQRIHQESNLRQGSIIRGHIPKGQLSKLAESPSVLWIEPGPKMKLFDEISSKIVAGDGGTHTLYTQLNGYDGTGVAVAVADSGLDTGDADTMHPDLFGRATNFFYYGNLTDASDEHSHGTHVAGIIAGNGAVGETDETDALYGLGVAPNARIITQRLFDGAGNFEPPPSFGAMTRDAVRAGADIGSNSWGDDTQGRYDTSAEEFDALVRDADQDTFGDQPYILEFSAGNAGPSGQSIGSPAVAKNVIATGASQNNRFDFFIYADGQEAMADFSSRGPCEDGRIKPDVVAPGTWIASLKSSYAGEDNAWSPISDYYLYMGGTSQAGPHASGAAAVFVQYYRQTHNGYNPSPALVKAALINSAVDMDDEIETEPVPNMDEGWGRIDLTELISSESFFQFVDQSVKLTTGQAYERRILVGPEEMPLKFTLAYSDVPGFAGAVPALVNDLDLEIIGPDGAHYHGNQFASGESLRNPVNYDSVNNVEGVHLNEPLGGEYLVRVYARKVVEDAVNDTPGVMDQDFALAISGDLVAPSASLLVFDRRFYTAPGQINVKLYDFDLTNRSSVSILIRSTTELNGESLTLRASASAGVFTGAVAVVTGPAVPDGLLQVSDGDTIDASYDDASPPATRTAYAKCDLLPPVIDNVVAVNRFGQTFISWDTDEPADALVLYGIDPANLVMTASSPTYRQSRTLKLTNVIPEVTYYFLVVSSDRAGNVSTNDHNGEFFSFVPVPAATVLLIDSYDSMSELFDVPLSSYTDALDQSDVSYEIWGATTSDPPMLSDMRAYPLLIWRLPEIGGTLSAADQAALTDYLNGGGALLIASMEQTSRLSEVGADSFRSNVLHIASYTADPPDIDFNRMVGATNDPISSGVSVDLDWTDYEEYFSILGNWSDTLEPGPGSVPIYFDESSQQPIGIRYPQTGVDAPGRVIYLSIPLNSIPFAGTPPNTRSHILANMISFLVPGVNGIGTIALDRNAYGLPSVITIEVADSDLKGQGQTSVQVFSSSVTTPQSVTLYETSRRGVFRGTINVVSTANAPASNQLRANSGDTIYAEYFDASLNRTSQITARIDTDPCVISAVEATPQYVNAFITWYTSEPADSLVQFGKSRLLDRQAYAPEFVADHLLELTGLEPEQTYYFRIVSRDEAGNSTIDTNNGALYSFTTLRPFYPPFSDSFDQPSDDWTVYTSDDSEGGWLLGTPNNGKETSAYSPPSAWGSNLNGDRVSFVESFLISPPIMLTGGNRANLHFWHSYDFTERSTYDIIEGGQVMIITNENSEPLPIAEFNMDEFSYGWEEANIDLSPYSGQLVYLVWYYVLISFSFDEVYTRPGWLVDDVSVTVSNVIPGTIIVTNNIWQSHFELTGPLNISGRGASLVITNAPPGHYALRFNDVPFYLTPSAQSNDLASLGSIRFQGDYGITDANNNGISDAWEQQFFNAVSPGRTQITDSDGDGATDYAEFLAGTDPRQPDSKLKVTNLRPLNNSTVRLEWAAVRDHAYRVEGSSDTRAWVPVSDWIHALSGTSYFVLPAPTPGGPYLFRIVVKP